MKKLKIFLVALMMIVVPTLFVGCGNSSMTAEGFSFTYKAKAEVTSENESKYLKIALEIKNTKNQENTLQASKFALKKGDETVSTTVIIGNNIVDAMETETFAMMATLDTTITIGLSETLEGAYQLYYGETKLFEINAQKATENTDSNNTDNTNNTNNTNNDTTNTGDPSLTA